MRPVEIPLLKKTESNDVVGRVEDGCGRAEHEPKGTKEAKAMALFAPNVLESGWMDRRVEGGELKLEGRSLVEERLERRGGLDWTERTTHLKSGLAVGADAQLGGRAPWVLSSRGLPCIDLKPRARRFP
jgi:hypothetical protein